MPLMLVVVMIMRMQLVQVGAACVSSARPICIEQLVDDELEHEQLDEAVLLELLARVEQARARDPLLDQFSHQLLAHLKQDHRVSEFKPLGCVG